MPPLPQAEDMAPHPAVASLPLGPSGESVSLPAGLPPMPPLPQDGAAPSEDLTGTLLAMSRSQTTRRGEGIWKRIMLGVDAFKRRTRTLKLRHEVSSLKRALESQLENLGTLALTHRPANVDISQQIAELSQLQRQLGEQEVTRDALRQGAGGGSVRKQIEGEIARLRDRQRQVLIAIGRKVAAARPDMPGAAGTYSALDRVQSSLTAAEAALAELEREIGPTGIFGILSPSAFALAVVLLFFPWVTVSCRDEMGMEREFLSQSGLQACYGGVSFSPEVEQERKRSEQPPLGKKGPSLQTPLSETSFILPEQPPPGKKGPSPAWLVILYTATIGIGLSLSVPMCMGNEQLRKWVIICSVVAFCLLAIQMIVGFPVDRELKQEIPPVALVVRYTIFLWLSLLVVLAPGLVAAGEEWWFRRRASGLPLALGSTDASL